MNRFSQLVLALLPLLLTPVIGFLLAEGMLNAGGGEKDILWAFVWAAWSIGFAVTSMFLIYRRWAVTRWLLRSALVSTGILLGLWLIALAVSFLGIV
jgi:hypothetical protein